MKKEHKHNMLRFALQKYIGSKCEFCDRIYDSVETLIQANPRWLWDDKLACDGCYLTKNECTDFERSV